LGFFFFKFVIAAQFGLWIPDVSVPVGTDLRYDNGDDEVGIFSFFNWLKCKNTNVITKKSLIFEVISAYF